MPNPVRGPKGRFLPRPRPSTGASLGAPTVGVDPLPVVIPEPTPLEVWQRIWRAADLPLRRRLLAWLQTQSLPGPAADSQEVWP